MHAFPISEVPAQEPSQYRAWLVDLDGTLYWAPGVKLAMALELCLFGLPKVARLRRFRHEHEALRRVPPADCTDPFAMQIERTANALALPPALLESDVRNWMIRRPARYIAWFRRKSLLREIGVFRDGGGRTALVSDYPAREKLSALGAGDLFEVVVANGEIAGPSRLKPDPDGYLRAARALAVPPEQCLVIGDRDDADGQAARAAGMGFRRIG